MLILEENLRNQRSCLNAYQPRSEYGGLKSSLLVVEMLGLCWESESLNIKKWYFKGSKSWIVPKLWFFTKTILFRYRTNIPIYSASDKLKVEERKRQKRERIGRKDNYIHSYYIPKFGICLMQNGIVLTLCSIQFLKKYQTLIQLILMCIVACQRVSSVNTIDIAPQEDNLCQVVINFW